MARETPSGPSVRFYEQKLPQPPETREIVSRVRQLEFYITEHVREHYAQNRNGDPDGAFGFEPLKGLGVQVAIRRYISLQAIELLNRDEYRYPNIGNFPPNNPELLLVQRYL